MKAKIAGIYKITSPSNKIYIGQSYNIVGRFNRYKSLKCARQVKIYNSLSKHGAENHVFEILHILPNDILPIHMDQYEIFYITQLKCAGFNLLNLQAGGGNGLHDESTKNKIRVSNTGKVFTEDRRKNISNSLKGKRGNRLGAKQSECAKEKIRATRIGCVLTDEIKAKISASLIGRITTNETRGKLSTAHKGKKHTDEHRENNANARIGKNASLESRRKMSESMRSVWEKRKLGI